MQIFPFENPKILIYIVLIIGLWSIPWKAMALWRSARRGQVGWFIFFVLVNTAGILEIIYLKSLSNLQAKNLDARRITRRI